MTAMRSESATCRLVFAAVAFVALTGLMPSTAPSWADEESNDGAQAHASAHAGIGRPEEAPPEADGPHESDYGAPEDPSRFSKFVEAIGRNADDVWSKAFAGSSDYKYESAQLELSEGDEPKASPCGTLAPTYNRDRNESYAFYCPRDRKIYLSLKWLGDQPRKFGDFAVASVIAHEFGHHVQATIGILGQPRKEKTTEELEADCLSGIWAFSAYDKHKLSDEAVDQAVALQYENADGRHGTGEQREKWFRDGFRDGEADDCDSWRWDDSETAPPNPDH